MPPLITGTQVFAVLPPGIVAAFGIGDGSEMWRRELNADRPLALAGDHLFVAAGEAIHVLRASDGEVVWRQPSGTLSAPLLVQDGWVIASADGHVTARRASDGSVVWKQPAGPQRHPASIEGDALYLPLSDGGVLALDLATGKERWRRRLRGEPSEILALPGRIYLGSDRHFYCLNADDGHTEWPVRLGAPIIGRPVVDGDHIYFAAMDNMLRALDRKNGAIRWNVGIPFRPTGTPLIVGSVIVVPGAAANLRTFDMLTGKTVAPIPFGERLASPPSFRETDRGPIAAAVTGGLNAEWKLLVLEPSLKILVEPLKVLPGQPVKWPAATDGASVPPARPLPAAAHLP
jgi:outer membrane protein assembly factor BamB